MLDNIRGMTNDNFIEFCYTTILRREADAPGKNYYTNALNNHHLSREDILLTFLTCEEFTMNTHSREFVPSGHFYSVIPSEEDKSQYLHEKKRSTSVLGVNLNDASQRGLLEIFRQFHDDCPFPDEKSEQYRYHFVNPSYSYGDALCLYSMIRHFQPKRIIEIGSGYSSCVMLDTNDLAFNGQIEMTFIEPYPQLLRSLMKPDDEKKHQILATPLQHADLNTFGSLRAHDILFIDSTHVSKLLSDVNRIFFEILPSLHKGVIIHFHDIFWPFEYPACWIKEGRAWNEAYVLRAFLEYNTTFEILLFTNYVYAHYLEWFKKNMPLFLKNAGGSIWLRKIG